MALFTLRLLPHGKGKSAPRINDLSEPARPSGIQAATFGAGIGYRAIPAPARLSWPPLMAMPPGGGD